MVGNAAKGTVVHVQKVLVAARSGMGCVITVDPSISYSSTSKTLRTAEIVSIDGA
jgi:hypothetical protein